MDLRMSVFTQFGWATLVAVGGGGSGGAANDTSTNYVNATGGGAGGFAMKKVYIPSGTTLVITVGAGGASVTIAGGVQTAVVGNSGGITSISSSIANITCNGGGGGQSIVSGSGANARSGGIGGSASGGDVNYTGGDGGDIVAQSQVYARATGGGAVGIFGTGYSAGDVTHNSTNNSPGVTGGAGVGGRSGNVTVNNGVTAGGSSAQASPNNGATQAATNTVLNPGLANLFYPGGTSVNQTGATTMPVVPGFFLFGDGGVGNNAQSSLGQPINGGPGAGGGGNFRDTFPVAGAGGIFAGGGGAATAGDGFVQSGAGRLGGGGGGAAGRNNPNNIVYGSDGGAGIVAIVFQGN
jgi:hypothetical protein